MTETKKNWPPCYPIIYHDIQAEILEDSAVRMAERSYVLWLAYIVTLIFNFISVVATTIANGNAGDVIVQILLAILYLFIWPLFDFFSRHISLYRAFKYDNRTSYRLFFLFTFLDIVFGIFIGVGFLYGGGGGLIAMINNFKHDPLNVSHIVAGVFSAICVFLVLSLTMFHVKLFRRVYKHFKIHDDWSLFPKRS
ncbi:scamp family-domain-containing protein [Glomus cerebriforme]|uniref:Scamp family-domain-containing protein n=1 Tax=Glomus cerebriforme TaxID=658196 RepID=A0A397TG77_9GLOM|nr:scamp family-domain-containing protein [Glomus cerebriforme]